MSERKQISRVYEFIYSRDGVVYKACFPAPNPKEAANRFRLAVEAPERCKIHRMRLYPIQLSCV